MSAPVVGSYPEFLERLKSEIAGRVKTTVWMVEVGYRPADKDMGLRRWCELAGTTVDAYLDSLPSSPAPVVPPAPVSPQLFFQFA